DGTEGHESGEGTKESEDRSQNRDDLCIAGVKAAKIEVETLKVKTLKVRTLKVGRLNRRSNSR
ncbi:MAG: hypothetical protein ACREDR_12455, partial [Blastocatellia bacterium]